jgi:hypothetical protein
MIRRFIQPKFKRKNETVAMCPKCYSLFDCKIGYKYNFKVETDNDLIMMDFNDVSIVGHCKHCKYTVYFILIDEKLSEIISTLNKKGYYTEFCCEGHFNKDENGDIFYDDAYIMFSEEGTMRLEYFMDYNALPEGWYIDKEDKRLIFRANIDNEIRENIPLEEIVKLMDKKIEEMRKFVENLPD